MSFASQMRRSRLSTIGNILETNKAISATQHLRHLANHSSVPQAYHQSARPQPFKRSSSLSRCWHTSTVFCPRKRRFASSGIALTPGKNEYNPPRSTLPPDLTNVERGKDNVFAYLWKLARAYGTFYKNGGKAIFTNRRLAAEVRQRLGQTPQLQTGGDSLDQHLVRAAIKSDVITRADFQLLRRNNHDLARLPIFGILIAIMGEWLPLIVPFMPYAVPLTCRIPSQVVGMRKKVEERRRFVFRQGIEAPSQEQAQQVVKHDAGETEDQDRGWPLLRLSEAQSLAKTLRGEQLWYLSCVLNLHSRLWESVQQRPPMWMMRRRLARKLHYLAQDDRLLTRHGNAASALEQEELNMACEERGLDVLGPSPKQLEHQLATWLRRDKEDQGRGYAMLHMLFRR